MSNYVTIGTTASTASANSIAVTTTQTCAAGSLVVMRAVSNQTGPVAGLAFSDSVGGNTWTSAIEGPVVAGFHAVIFYSVLTNAIPSGQTITMSWTTAVGFRGMDGITCSNPQASPLDVTPTKSSTGTGTAVTSGTTASPSTSDWVGVFLIYHADGLVTPQAGWTEDDDSSALAWETQTTIGTNTTAMQGAGTLGTSAQWVANVAVFMLSTVAASSPARDTHTAIPFTQGAGGGGLRGGPH